MPPFQSLAEVYCHIATHYSNPKALNLYEDGKWRSVSTKEFTDSVKYLALGLLSLGVKKGECIGIFAPSSPEWMIADFAIMMMGGVVVPLFASISVDNLEFEVEQTEMSAIFVDDEDPWKIVDAHSKDFPLRISLGGKPESATHSLEEVIEMGRVYEKEQPYLFGKLLDQVKSDDLATIIYTSGSTGVPKGAELTHENLCHLIPIEDFQWDAENDRYLSILPLAHIFARQINLLLFAWGVPLYYLNDTKKLGEACQEVRPTLMIVVPRVLEKVYAKMLAKIEKEGFFKKAIAGWAFSLAGNGESSLYKQLFHPIADALVYSALREAMGGNFRVIVSGGAKLNPELNQFFLDIGVPVYEGWGMTEVSTIAVNRPGNQKVGTVGPKLGNVEFKVTEDGELLARGPTRMQGYYKNAEMTAKVIDAEGWFYTGDKAEIDTEGFITIQGRIKEMFKTSTGEFLSPLPTEQVLCEAPLIDLAMVIGEGKPYCTCLLFPDPELVNQLKASAGAEGQSLEEFLRGDYIKGEMGKLIEQINAHLNEWEKLRDWRFVTSAPTIQGGELTPTMKIRREVVMEKYQDLVNEMYPEKSSE